MTPEQVELEFEHIRLDAIEKQGNQVYEDDEYEKYDKESEEHDSVLSEPTFKDEAEEIVLPKNVETNRPDEWEDVEIDDFEGD